MTTTITIAYDVPADKFAEVEALAEHHAIHNVNHNGEVFNVERGDFTCIDKESYNHASLLRQIFNIIEK
ncbi:hypothetical protein KGP17_27560 (plasmid) [Serratia sp. JSRIV001]|jgi:hypothetical protein|uniref:hypothetical protein n=1 Tax=unclassified Serratia (in: enterobacteria) TaxID=2647522 RepID=UPI001CBC5F70|nr:MULTISPECIES: hypothetical protein [unclassified Serratia (in: enterobacteria)]UAN48775.1 hypothetical protein KGP17_27560 [Serratia sp. JSRIV001]UAN54474.1 hypothetical protein KGP26_28825 [Serratia sp. JSRIV002]UAN60587.1 hypothetical protein KGP21_29040 [Serratia sp. JSRIV004]